MAATKKSTSKKPAAPPEDDGTLEIDLNALTNGDILDIEEKSGMQWSEIGELDDPPFRVVLALVWVQLRRDDPSMTWEKVRDMPVTDILVDGDTSPTDAAG